MMKKTGKEIEMCVVISEKYLKELGEKGSDRDEGFEDK